MRILNGNLLKNHCDVILNPLGVLESSFLKNCFFAGCHNINAKDYFRYFQNKYRSDIVMMFRNCRLFGTEEQPPRICSDYSVNYYLAGEEDAMKKIISFAVNGLDEWELTDLLSSVIHSDDVWQMTSWAFKKPSPIRVSVPAFITDVLDRKQVLGALENAEEEPVRIIAWINGSENDLAVQP